MIHKTALIPERVRRIKGSFAAIEHRFLRDGFWQSLSHHELLLYFFLVLVGDRSGISFYSYDRIIALLHLRLDEYIQDRDALIAKDLIASDGHLFQVLSRKTEENEAKPKDNQNEGAARRGVDQRFKQARFPKSQSSARWVQISPFKR